MKREPILLPLGDEPLLSAGELQRAARRQLRRRASQRGDLPWRVPLLFVPGRGGSRLALLAPQTWFPQGVHETTLWDPDDELAHTLIYGHQAGAEAELAARWQSAAQVLRAPHEPAERLRLMARRHALDAQRALISSLELALLDRYARLHAQGWAALPQAYWPLAVGLADVPGTTGDPQFAHSAHAFAWDWRARPAEAAPDLAQRIQTLLIGVGAPDSARVTRRAESPGLVIVAENLGLDLVRATLPVCAPGAVLAVYAVDEASPAAGLPACLLSMGWQSWHANLSASALAAVNAGLPGSVASLRATPPASVNWIPCLPTTHPSDDAAVLRADSPAQLCNAIRRHIAQQLLRQPPTPWGQELAPGRLSPIATGESRS